MGVEGRREEEARREEGIRKDNNKEVGLHLRYASQLTPWRQREMISVDL